MNTHQKISCPACNKRNTWHSDNPFKPFCSDRCKLIDLGEWASETRKIPGGFVDSMHSSNINPHQEEMSDDMF
ncbi:DNA gyrase inhibitor YacG [Legionella gratiana]|nr:DNA gyrase inhibitor YacG [Legionella gratiana]